MKFYVARCVSLATPFLLSALCIFLSTSSVHGNDVTYWDTKMAFTSASILSRGVDFYNYLLKEHFKEEDSGYPSAPEILVFLLKQTILLVFPVL